MKELTKIEETILLAVFRLKDDTYGVTIKEQINRTTGRQYLYSTLYTTLEQLVRKEYIVKRLGDPSPVRGGKRKIFFDLTEKGSNALKESFLLQKSVWHGITEKSFRTG